MVDTLTFLSSSWRSLSNGFDQRPHDCWSRGMTVEEMRQASIALQQLALPDLLLD